MLWITISALHVSITLVYGCSNYCRVGGPEASEVAAMISTGMRTFFQSGVRKNFKSLYQSFVPQKFASAHVCANRYNRKNKFLVRCIQTRLDCWIVWLNYCAQRAQ